MHSIALAIGVLAARVAILLHVERLLPHARLAPNAIAQRASRVHVLTVLDQQLGREIGPVDLLDRGVALDPDDPAPAPVFEP